MSIPATQLPLDRLYYGGDYNPEQWPESVWPDDMRLMRAAGVNLVTIGVFSWARLQSAPGRFHFEWLDRLMDLLAAHGIQADLATATASPPPWLTRLHPDILPVTEDGRQLSPGARQHYNPSSRAYRAACAELVTALAERYGRHPALAIWHVNNEYACHVAADYGDETAAAFLAWLQARYGSLDALNAAWGTAFWSQHYYAWEEILPPRAAPTFRNPTHCLDFQRFSSDAILACARLEIDLLRRITPDKPITTNFMGFFKPVDYRAQARDLDFVCHDVYPEPEDAWTGPARVNDFTRSLKDNAPWLVMEQVTTHVNWRARNTTKPPGMMRRLSLQAVARGADGICFFQWRQSRAGAEKFHGAMVGHAQQPESQRCFREVCELGADLAKLTEVAGSRVQAPIGILFDYATWWALELPSKVHGELSYVRASTAFHLAAQHAGLATDYVFADSDLSRYRVLYAPLCYLTTPALAQKIDAWVRAGGCLVLTYFSGIVDEHDHIHLGGYPAPFRSLLGLTVEEWAVPPASAILPLAVTAEGRAAGLASAYSAQEWAEVVRIEGAEVLATFGNGYYAGLPAITRHRAGLGSAWYLATEPEERFYADLVRSLAAAHDLRAPCAAPADVERTERVHADGRRYLFLLNHAAELRLIADAGLVGVNLLDGQRLDGSLHLEPGGCAVIRRDPLFSS